MSKRDHKRSSHDTARFDSSSHVVLMKTPLAEGDPDVRNPDVGGPLLSRVATLHDPLTTGLLAEVSRRMETLDFDEETIEEAKRTEPSVSARPAIIKR